MLSNPENEECAMTFDRFWAGLCVTRCFDRCYKVSLSKGAQSATFIQWP